MTHQTILTLDVGTSSTKTALWDASGRLLAEASASYALRRPDPLWAEIDGETWWAAIRDTVRQVVAAAGVSPRSVSGIGVDGVGWTLLPVDRDARPLFPALIWLDRRAQAETAWLNALSDAARLVDLVANPLDAAYITPKLLWLKQHHPDVFDAAHRFLSASGFVVARLTGEFTCDVTQAYGYHFFDIRRASWDPWAADRVGVPLEKMPRLCGSAEIVGALTPSAASDLGLAPGVPVIAGCLDAASGALGAGVTRPQQTNEQGGQAGGMAVSMTRVVVEPRLIFSHHAVPGQYILQAGTVGGGSLGWFRDVIGPDAGDYARLSQLAGEAAPGAGGVIFLPYMAGERTPLWSSTARGVFFGLSYTTTRSDLLRAIMEGCAFAVYDNLRIAEMHGATVTEYLGSGGATRSPVWCQIKADVYGRPFTVARRADGGEGGHNLGLYALAAHAVGWYDDIGACVESLLPDRQVYEPSPDRHALYQELFEVYRSVSRRAQGDFERLAAITRRHAPVSGAPILDKGL